MLIIISTVVRLTLESTLRWFQQILIISIKGNCRNKWGKCLENLMVRYIMILFFMADISDAENCFSQIVFGKFLSASVVNRALSWQMLNITQAMVDQFSLSWMLWVMVVTTASCWGYRIIWLRWWLIERLICWVAVIWFTVVRSCRGCSCHLLKKKGIKNQHLVGLQTQL